MIKLRAAEQRSLACIVVVPEAVALRHEGLALVPALVRELLLCDTWTRTWVSIQCTLTGPAFAALGLALYSPLNAFIVLRDRERPRDERADCTCAVGPAVAQRDQRPQQVLAAVRHQVVVRVHPQRVVEPGRQVLLPCRLRAGEKLLTARWCTTPRRPADKA